ncbi:hypothetical protein SLA2020_093470 [Shorea laevis]
MTVPGLTLCCRTALCLGFQDDVSLWQIASAFALVPSDPTNGTTYASVLSIEWHLNTANGYFSLWQTNCFSVMFCTNSKILNFNKNGPQSPFLDITDFLFFNKLKMLKLLVSDFSFPAM